MNATVRLTAFAAGLAVVFGGAAAAGSVVDPDRQGDDASAHDVGHADSAMASHRTSPAGAHPVRRLAVAERGLRLIVSDRELRRDRVERLRFRIADTTGRTVRTFETEHTKRMHLIIARRDLSGFQHLHPRQAADGSWHTTLRLTEAGSYRMFADFVREDEPQTLAEDLAVDGPADLRPLPAAASTAVSDGGSDVRVTSGAVRPGREADLRFTISRDGRPVRPERYLGAGGHLVALRDGDLAFLHVHPSEHAEDADQRDKRIGFEATFPSAGRYRLFLQFKDEGRVQTVAFTQEVQ